MTACRTCGRDAGKCACSLSVTTERGSPSPSDATFSSVTFPAWPTAATPDPFSDNTERAMPKNRATRRAEEREKRKWRSR